jgi:hypothetical protein
VLYAADSQWWRWHSGVPGFAGLKYTLKRDAAEQFPDITCLSWTGTEGLELDPRGLRTGHHGGYQAINMAVHLGARRVGLLGYDLQPTGGLMHWFGHHRDLRDGTPMPSEFPFQLALGVFPSLFEPLRLLGVTVINCTRETALTCFKRQPIEEFLAEVAA